MFSECKCVEPKIVDASDMCQNCGLLHYNHLFTWSIPFKDSDGCGEFARFADKPKRESLKQMKLWDDEITPDQMYDDPTCANQKFFRYGEFGTLEVKLNKYGIGTARLIPQEETLGAE
jgi:hypothetical protein